MDLSVQELDKQIAELEAKRNEKIAAERADVLTRVKADIKTYKITPTELKGVLKPLRKRRAAGDDGAPAKKPAAKKRGAAAKK